MKKDEKSVKKNNKMTQHKEQDLNLGLSDIDQLNLEIEKNQIQNLRIGNSEVRLIGDKLILIQVIKLLAYIRHAVKNNLKTEINVKLGEKIADGQFLFDVNQQEIPDFITQKEIEIN